MPQITTYPTLELVEAADIVQLCTWTRFLASPGAGAINKSRNTFYAVMGEEVKILERIMERQKELGGWTPELSKLIGWE